MGTREDFEKWYSDDGKSTRAIERHGEGYKLAQANSAWETWKVAVSVEREACALICDRRGFVAIEGGYVGHDCADEIRERSNVKCAS